MSEDEISLDRNDAESRYEVRLGAALGGYARYRADARRIVFTHTVVDPEHEGHGLGSRLAKYALDDAVERGLIIVSECPFIGAYLKKHEEYEDSVRWPPRRP
jgi:uncharacterized protein